MSRGRSSGFTDLLKSETGQQPRDSSDYVAPLEVEGPRSPPGTAAGASLKRIRQARKRRGKSGSDVFTFVPDKV